MKTHFLPHAFVFVLVCTGALAQPTATPPVQTPPANPPPAATASAPSPAAATPAANGRRGGRGAAATTNQPGHDSFYKLGPDSLPMTGVPQGKFSAAKVIPSAIFPGTEHRYTVYVPAQYDPAKPTAIMLFNDGQAMMDNTGDVRGQNVLDNLIYRHEIPVMLGVFINPGKRPDQPEPTRAEWGDKTGNRSAEYNPATEQYARVIVEEIMPQLKKDYNISPDPNLHGIMGTSSGGCAAFEVAWFRPDDFRKVITFVGSFTDLRGEYVYPEFVAAADKKPIRIFMQDGRNDNRVPGQPNRDWFLQNVRLKDALEKKGYEVNYAWGMNDHGQKMGGAIFPDMMRWLWRDQPVDTDPTDMVERAFRAPVPHPDPAAVPAPPAP